MNIVIITLISIISFMVYFFFAVGTYRLCNKIHSPYDDKGREYWHTDDIKGWNSLWAFIWPISLPFALIYMVFTTRIIEDAFVKCGEGFANTYKVYNRILDIIFHGTI